jgi:Haem-binding domain
VRIRGRQLSWKRLLLLLVLGALGLFALIQAVPYGRSHTNPPVTQEPRWDSPRTRQLASDACFDCHSNLTTWPWYSDIAPVSWLTQGDVDSGRQTLNFSEWNRPQEASPGDLAEAIDGGGMPPWYYRLAHPNSRLSASERAALIAGLRRTVAADPPVPGGG